MDKEKIQIYTVTAIIVAILFFTFISPSVSQGVREPNRIATTDTVQNGNVQVVELSVKEGNYYPQVIKLKQNIPVQMVVDLNTVKGCLTSIRIPEYGVKKTVTRSDNIITFTPTKTGTFPFSCSMGMGTGT